ncbi:MAG: transporter permease [Candidatus Saccharibacteria bacterium]|nr:transporter permease [Candidatus Saccharibacteria bacterium]
MMRSVYLKTLYDKRWFVFGWTLGFVALSVLMTSFFPAMRQTGALDALVTNMPPALQGLIGNLGDLKSFPTYIASQLFDIRVPLIAGVMAIILALGLSTAEEERGELRTLLSLPISRTKLLIEKWLALGTIMAISTLGIIIGILASAPLVDGASIELSTLLHLVAMTWLIMVTFGTVTFAAGFASGSRAFANTLGVLVIIGSFILSTFGQSVDWLSDFEKFSLLHYFPAVEIAKNSIDFNNVVVLGTVAAVSLIIAVILFRRRDVA